jgi:CRISPR/Cas system-associated endoribonuclease Cas2
MFRSSGGKAPWTSSGTVVAYDIGSSSIRLETANQLGAVGWRIQFSVFWIPPSIDPQSVIATLPNLNGSADSVLAIPLRERCTTLTAGEPYERPHGGWIAV